jgi:spore germination protein
MKYFKIIALILCCTFLGGCWDKIEIDRRLFVSTIGVDVGKDISKEKELKNLSPNDPFGELQMRKLKVTYGFPNISALSPGNSGTAAEKNLSVDAYSMEDAYNKTSAKSSRSVSFGHTELLILSKNLLAYPDTVKEVIDYFQREASINKVLQVVIAEGNIDDFVNYQPATEKNIESYIAGLMENSAVNANLLPITLNEFLILLNENGNAILPRLTIDKEKNELKVNGVSIIKNYVVKGDLNPVETSDLEILRGKLKGGKKVIFKDGHPIDLKIEDLKRRISVEKRDGKVEFNIRLSLEGQVKEYYIGRELFDTKTLNEVQQNFNNAISTETQKVIKRLQGEFGVDPVGLREYVEKYHPYFWNEIKDNWEQSYKDAVINVTVDTKIRRIGVSK